MVTTTKRCVPAALFAATVAVILCGTAAPVHAQQEAAAKTFQVGDVIERMLALSPGVPTDATPLQRLQAQVAPCATPHWDGGSAAPTFEFDEACLGRLAAGMLYTMSEFLGVPWGLVPAEEVWAEADVVLGDHIEVIKDEARALLSPELASTTDEEAAAAVSSRVLALMTQSIRVIMPIIERLAKERMPPAPTDDPTAPAPVAAPEAATPADESEVPAHTETPAIKEERLAKPAPASGPAKDEEGCSEGAKADVLASGDGGKKTTTPDLAEGPWHANQPPHPFEVLGDRPGIARAAELLKEVLENVAAIELKSKEARSVSAPIEERLIAESKAEAADLEGDLQTIREAAAAHAQIAPTAGEMSRITNEELSPELARIATLYDTDAETRYPFAQRIAGFSQDLVKAVRSRDSTCAQLKEYLPPQQLDLACAQYGAVVDKLQTKIADEKTAAANILNKNDAEIEKSKGRISSAEARLEALQATLDAAVDGGKTHAPGVEGVKQQLLSEEKDMASGLVALSNAEDDLVAQSESIGKAQKELIDHVQRLLAAMLEPDVATPDGADLPAAAHRRIIYPDGEQPGAPLHERVTKLEVPMPGAPVDPEE